MRKHLPFFCLALTMACLLLFMAACGSDNTSTPTSEAPPQVAAIQGTVTDATMNTLTIQVPNGSEYTFGIEDVEISSPDGILLGDTITIQYTGVFDDTKQQQDVAVVSVVVDVEGDNHAAQTVTSTPAAPTGDVKIIEGTIEQYDGATMMIVDATGVDYLFSLDGTDLHVGEEGFQVGDIVTVYYYGELASTPDLQSVFVGEVKKADQ